MKIKSFSDICHRLNDGDFNRNDKFTHITTQNNVFNVHFKITHHYHFIVNMNKSSSKVWNNKKILQHNNIRKTGSFAIQKTWYFRESSSSLINCPLVPVVTNHHCFEVAAFHLMRNDYVHSQLPVNCVNWVYYNFFFVLDGIDMKLLIKYK